MTIKFTTEELNAASAHLWQLLVEGETDAVAQDKMGVDSATYHKIKTHMLDGKAHALRNLPTEHVYVQYILDQAQNIRELADMVKQFNETKQYNAMVGAIRLKADLYDRILTKGQECGIIDKEPERHELIAGVIVADLNNNQLRGQLRRELKAITGMMEEHGDVNFIDVEAGETHHGPKLKKPKQAKRGSKKQRVVGDDS